MSEIESVIYQGNVMHSRVDPVEHSFNYNIYFYAFNLDELANLDKNIKLFSYNKKNIISIYDKDYLTIGNESIKEKVLSYLAKHNHNETINKIILITSAKYFNYIFNPVSYYYCYNNDKLTYIIVEINNTFKEKHIYILKDVLKEQKNLRLYKSSKVFHISPFKDLKGEYEFWFSDIQNLIDIRINLVKNNKITFYTRQKGEALNMSNANLVKTIIKFPFSAALTMPRILWQAARLHYEKKLPVWTKPRPKSIHTIRYAKPNLLQKLALNYTLNIFKLFKNGSLTVILPDNQIYIYGDSSSSLKATLEIEHYDFFKYILIRGDIGLGEAYTDELFKSSDLTKLIEIFIANVEVVDNRKQRFAFLYNFKNYLEHLLLRFNNLKGSKKNISAHYDLSNELFKTFLDDSMTYSSGIFNTKYDSLKDSQNIKIDRLIDQLILNKDDHLLEIGTGWGYLAIRAVQKTGCKVTTITLSQEQKSYAEKRIKELGLEDNIKVKLCDFRNITGKFDKIVSVEMIEAIGFKNYPLFFKKCEEVLKPDGLIALQSITIPCQKFKGLKRRCDWIQKYIFPGSLLPSVTALSDAMNKNSSFIIEDIKSIGPSYAITLNIWKEKFNKNIDKVLQLGFDEKFIRIWNYYLSYCEAGFSTRTLNVVQVTFTRPENKFLVDNFQSKFAKNNEILNKTINE